MKRLLLLAILGAALYWGYTKNWDFGRPAGNEAVLVNRSGRDLDRIRLTIGGETLVREALADGERASLTFRQQRDGAFRLVWHAKGVVGERTWSGGHLVGGPAPSVHTFEFDAQHGVVWFAKAKPAP